MVKLSSVLPNQRKWFFNLTFQNWKLFEDTIVEPLITLENKKIKVQIIHVLLHIRKKKSDRELSCLTFISIPLLKECSSSIAAAVNIFTIHYQT